MGDCMGILFNTLSILFGIFLGNIFKDRINFKNFTILGIAIMIISLVGFIENIFGVQEFELKSNALLIVVFALIIGTILGEVFCLDLKLGNISNNKNKGLAEIIDTTIFFGVGGMQICGPVMLAAANDNSQLILKSMIDFPFALMFGMSYGKRVALSAFIVAAGQIGVLILTILTKSFLDTYVIRQICSIGYIILFFSGFNLLCEKQHKINNINMLIGIFVILLYNGIRCFWR